MVTSCEAVSLKLFYCWGTIPNRQFCYQWYRRVWYICWSILVTDNYSLNVRLFKMYSPDQRTLLPAVQHPTCPERKLYILFDFVHIIKSIRNNWLNLKDYDLTFKYPDMLIYSQLPSSPHLTRMRRSLMIFDYCTRLNNILLTSKLIG